MSNELAVQEPAELAVAEPPSQFAGLKGRQKAAVLLIALGAQNAAEIGKYAGLGVASLIFLFFVGRHLRKREDEALGAEPMWLRQIEAPQSLSELEAAQGGGGAGARNAGVDQRQKVEEAVRKEPERVAAQVRSWLSEEL